MRPELKAEVDAINLNDWTRTSGLEGVEYTYDDYHEFTIVLYRGDGEVKWGATALWGTYDNPQDKELGGASVSVHAAAKNALYRVAEMVSIEYDAADAIDALLAEQEEATE